MVGTEKCTAQGRWVTHDMKKLATRNTRTVRSNIDIKVHKKTSIIRGLDDVCCRYTPYLPTGDNILVRVIKHGHCSDDHGVRRSVT